MKRLGRKVRTLHTPDKEGSPVKCDICNEEFANSEEVKRHKEQVHPMGEEAGEAPDLMEKPVESEMPEPAEQGSK